jgi:hypothetical protein
MKMPAVQLSAATQKYLDPDLTLALVQASVAAYSDYEKKPYVWPKGYNLVAHWTGWDEFFGSGVEERFGLVFQSKLDPTEFIFAFRGTDSDWDILEDLFIETTSFSPYEGKVNPTPSVASGFYSIYNNRGASMIQSMRQQLFALLDKFKPQKVYITGHSLGAALSQLFTLDIAVSRPGLWAANINFSSPMVGLSDWKTAYESQPAQKSPETVTVRVYNYWDVVPSLPDLPPPLPQYTHVGVGFRTSFYADSIFWYLYPGASHSVLNLQVVLKNALPLNPQVWVGLFQDQSGYWDGEMASTALPAAADVHWAEEIRELDQFRQNILESSPAFKAGVEPKAV